MQTAQTMQRGSAAHRCRAAALRRRGVALVVRAAAVADAPRTSKKMPNFPFVKIAGQEEMKLALLLNIVDPNIGGVLIMGDRGTGKSVAVSGRWDGTSRCGYRWRWWRPRGWRAARRGGGGTGCAAQGTVCMGGLRATLGMHRVGRNWGLRRKGRMPERASGSRVSLVGAGTVGGPALWSGA